MVKTTCWLGKGPFSKMMSDPVLSAVDDCVSSDRRGIASILGCLSSLSSLPSNVITISAGGEATVG